MDDPLVRLSADIVVRRKGHADAHAPALARPHLGEKPVDVEHHRRRRLARQHLLEMLPRQLVLALQEKGPAELQADPNQAGPRDQHGMEGGDGLVQQRIARVLRYARFLRRTDRRQAEQEDRAGIDLLAPDKRPEDRQRLVELSVRDQRSGLDDAPPERRPGILRGGHRKGKQQDKGHAKAAHYCPIH